MNQQTKLFELIPEVLPEQKPANEDRVNLLIADMKRMCEDAKRRFEAGTLYEYQKKQRK